MGASAVMMACGEEDLNDRVVCAIEELSLIHILSHNEEVDQLISVIKTIRQVRVDYNLKPSAPLAMTIRNAQNQPVAVNAPIASIYEKMCKASCCLLYTSCRIQD